MGEGFGDYFAASFFAEIKPATTTLVSMMGKVLTPLGAWRVPLAAPTPKLAACH